VCVKLFRDLCQIVTRHKSRRLLLICCVSSQFDPLALRHLHLWAQRSRQAQDLLFMSRFISVSDAQNVINLIGAEMVCLALRRLEYHIFCFLFCLEYSVLSLSLSWSLSWSFLSVALPLLLPCHCLDRALSLSFSLSYRCAVLSCLVFLSFLFFSLLFFFLLFSSLYLSYLALCCLVICSLLFSCLVLVLS
jgi:hypothetical protein